MEMVVKAVVKMQIKMATGGAGCYGVRNRKLFEQENKTKLYALMVQILLNKGRE
jgi:hypothetical protein